MKSFYCCMMFLLLASTSFSQAIPAPPNSQEFYLQKSKNQNSGAKVLLIGGAALIGGGLLIGDSKESTFSDAATGALIGAVGTLSCIGSIPLFIAANKNKNLAKRTSFYFKLQQKTTAKAPNLSFRQSTLTLQIQL